MKFPIILLPVLFVVQPLTAATINDGTTTNSLVRFAAVAAPGTTALTLAPDGTLEARVQAPSFAFPFLQTAWYSAGYSPTGASYTVTADFKPAEAGDYALVGGVAGWLNLASSNAITFYGIPAGDDRGFYLGVVNFAAVDPAPGLVGLFGTNGVPVANDLALGRSTINPNFQVALPATFELAFTVPTAQDLVLVPAASAHLTARVWQGSGPNRVLVSQTLELLTDLPVPATLEHRVGYYSVYTAFFAVASSKLIGNLDNLTLDGGYASTTPPKLAASLSGNTFTVSWDQAGFQLESTTDLGTNWGEVSTTGTQYSEPATATRKFFRLRR